MANPANRPSVGDFREKILKEGVLKHRQSSIGLPRWRPRYVVFKVTSSGRYQFIVYKEQPFTPANEVKEVPIEEFGGLDINPKIDSEKNTFAIITTSTTDCFSTETPDEMVQWTRVLQEYLGKELVLNITIPHKQNMLKSGRAQMRVRNTGFTITTCDTPPRCQGTWQIIHIRKFGGSDNFRFETGSKCPSGEYRYTIYTDSNDQLKSLFHDLSQHKPLFTDDRLGRRMTLERRNREVASLGHSRVSSRSSLQPVTDTPAVMYENRQVIMDKFRHNAADPVNISPPTGRRHSAVDDHIFNPQQIRATVGNGSPRAAKSIEDLSGRLYQNVQHGGRRSPTKRVSQLNPITSREEVHESSDEYYKVTPPRALRKFRCSSSSPPDESSPVENGFIGGGETSPTQRKTPPISEGGECERAGLEQEGYVQFSSIPLSPVKVSLQQRNVVVKRDGPPVTLRPQQQQMGEALYENLEFKKGSGIGCASTGGSPGIDERKRVSTSSSQGSDSTLPSPLTDGAGDMGYSNYTNVDQALQAAQRRPQPVANKSSERTRPHHFSVEGRRTVHHGPVKQHSAVSHKSSAPVFVTDPPYVRSRSKAVSSMRNRSGAVSQKKSSLVSPTKTSAPAEFSPIRSSRSNFELHSPDKKEHTATELHRSASPPEYYNSSAFFLPANSKPHADHSNLGLSSESQGMENEQHNRLSHVEEHVRTMGPKGGIEDTDHIGNAEKTCPSYYDRLEIRSPDRDTNSPQPSYYDTLTPIDRKSKQTSSPTKKSHSSPSSPEPLTPYQKKVAAMGSWVRHSYEYIDIDLVHQNGATNTTPLPQASYSHNLENSRSASPEVSGNEHPQQWLSPQQKKSFKLESGDPTSPAETSTESRRKPIPLPRTNRMDSKPSADQSQSFDCDDPSRRQSTLSNESVSSAEQEKRPPSLLSEDGSDRSSRSSSPSRRLTHEHVSLKQPSKVTTGARIQSIRVETVSNSDSSSNVGTPSHSGSHGMSQRPPRHAGSCSDHVSNLMKSSRPPVTYEHPPHPIRANNESHLTRSEELPPPPIPPRPKEPEESELTLSLPEATIGFDKPAVPPRPNILNQQHLEPMEAPAKYIAVEFPSSQPSFSARGMRTPIISDIGDSGTRTSQPHALSRTVTSVDDSGIIYHSIDFNMSAKLAEMKEQVEDQRTKELQFIEASKKLA